MSEYEKAIDLMGQEIRDLRTGMEKFIGFVNSAKKPTDINNAILFARTVLEYSGPQQPTTKPSAEEAWFRDQHIGRELDQQPATPTAEDAPQQPTKETACPCTCHLKQNRYRYVPVHHEACGCPNCTYYDGKIQIETVACPTCNGSKLVPVPGEVDTHKLCLDCLGTDCVCMEMLEDFLCGPCVELGRHSPDCKAPNCPGKIQAEETT